MDIIQQIKENITVKDLASVLGLKRKGKNYHCPAHKDNTPSLSINERSNYFKCFSCNTAGDVFELYKLYHNESNFENVVRGLCSITGINYTRPTYKPDDLKERPGRASVKPENKPPVKRQDLDFNCIYDQYYYDERAAIMEFCGNIDRAKAERTALQQVKRERLSRNKVIFNELYQFCDSAGLDEKIYNYLSNERKLSDKVIISSRIFSINDIKKTEKHLLNLFDVQELYGSGLFKYNKESQAANLLFKATHRLIIPYIENGEIVYLRSRYFNENGNNKVKGLKYFGLITDDLNLNRTKRFYNSDTLNGLSLFDKVYLTEGEIDALTLQTLDLKAIAIPGVPSFPDAEISRLKNCHVVIAMDNDPSGIKAKEELKHKFKTNGVRYSVIKLPDGVKDVNEFLINELKQLK